MHCDLKPDNICVKETTDQSSGSKRYAFSLIDFGLIQKVKLGKIFLYETKNKGGNKQFASLRALQRKQVRF